MLVIAIGAKLGSLANWRIKRKPAGLSRRFIVIASIVWHVQPAQSPCAFLSIGAYASRGAPLGSRRMGGEKTDVGYRRFHPFSFEAQVRKHYRPTGRHYIGSELSGPQNRRVVSLGLCHAWLALRQHYFNIFCWTRRTKQITLHLRTTL
jgi:hypothetical protein